MTPKKKQPRVYCSVMGCRVTSINSPGTHFYSFPSLPHRLIRRRTWIEAVRNHHPRQAQWLPSMYSRICSHHFVGNEKSENPNSPAYNPTIFSKVYRKPMKSAQVKRRKRKDPPNEEDQSSNKKKKTQLDDENLVENNVELSPNVIGTKDQETQVNFQQTIVYYSLYNFSCKLYSTDTTCEAEVQTSIQKVLKFGTNRYDGVDKSTNTDFPSHDKSCQTEPLENDTNSLSKRLVTYEISSIKSDREMLNIAGTTLGVFHMLLKILNRPNLDAANSKLPIDKTLLIFLMRMKTGLSFSAISAIFAADRMTVSRTFYITLMYLAAACKKFVSWPTKEVVQGTMPEAFKQCFKHCRVIIDCFEMPVGEPSSDMLSLKFCSDCTDRFTIKVLVGYTPNGLVSFVSRCYPGSTSESEIVNSCGILNLLNAGDTVIADKTFRAIKEIVEDNNQDINVIRLSFTDNPSCSENKIENIEQMRKVAIDLKRNLRRMRAYKLLNKLQVYMYPDSDSILFMCAVLVNCQVIRQL